MDEMVNPGGIKKGDDHNPGITAFQWVEEAGM
jgi:hypothetical protein